MLQFAPTCGQHSIQLWPLQALRELFLKIGGTGEWLQGGGIIDTILATVEDYLTEYLTYLQPAFANRCQFNFRPTRRAEVIVKVREKHKCTWQSCYSYRHGSRHWQPWTLSRQVWNQ